MHIFELIKLSLKSLYGFKMRSFLTTLGIIVGIGSVVMISSLGAGFQDGLLSDVTKTYSKIFTVTLNMQKFEKVQKDRKYYFNLDDISSIKKLDNIDKVYSEASDGGYGLDSNGEELLYILSGADKEGYSALNFKLTSGRSFTDDEFKTKNNLAIIGRTSAVSLFGSEKNALGKKVSFDSFETGEKYEFNIIGTYIEPEEKAKKTFSNNYISLITNVYNLNVPKSDFLTSLTIKVKDETQMENTVKIIKKYLNNKSANLDIYDLRQSSEDLNQASDILNKISIFISLVASISLAVGGIGVMNIMLVSVTERISEIGLRKAIGAKNKDILIQFLIESITLTLIGGLIGVIFGVTLAFLIGIPFEITPILKPKVLMLSLIVSMGTGLIFGIYPAKKASKLSPMEALRTE
ncbi:ABC transporter permease [Streptobacillus felis]|uniref:ABC transporter permease n=1 Tax=Streptobacillus felis TaxID=1384509 RepID=UPI0009E6F517|nr:ABC transporter permease [Streptobacillus felis]